MFLQKLIFILSGLFLSITFSAAEQLSVNSSSASDSTKIENFAPIQNSLADSIVNYGKMFLNTPYHYGSPGSGSFDCSGFTSYVYRNFGYNLQHSSADQAQQFDSVDRGHLKTGDLVFFSGRARSSRVGHVGIVTKAKENGQFEFIHAAVRSGVIISNSDEDYYTKRFVKANRVVSGNSLLAVASCANETTKLAVKPEIEVPMSVPVRKTQKVIPAKFHKVKSGETLSTIADKYGLSTAELKRKNNIKGSKINRNQELKIRDRETITTVEPVQVAVTKTNNVSKNPVVVKNEAFQTNVTPAISSHTVKKGETLFSIAKLYNLSVDDLKKINEIPNGKIIQGQELKISQLVEKEVKVAVEKPEIQQNMITHEVTSGETLFSIAKKYNVTTEDLKKMNNLTRNSIQLGQKIKINNATETAKSNTAKPLKENESVSKEVAAKEVVTKSISFYKVQKGDNLNSIAEKFNVSVEDLKKNNNLTDNKIKFGQELKITQTTENVTSKSDVAKSDVHSKTITHKVTKGETLISIAEKFNVSVEDLKKDNQLTGNKIKFNQELKLTQTTEKGSLKSEVANSDIPTKTITHKVTKGETLISIAKDFNMTLDELKEMNNLNDNKIKFGQDIVVNQSKSTTMQNTSNKSETKSKPIHYKIKSGDSFYSIAEKYGCTMNEIKEWNNKSGSKLNIGDEIVVYKKSKI